jgi:lysophospholipase L1-like esterase
MGDPSLAASDGFHPGPGAYAIWADALVAALAALPARGQPSTA